MSDSDLKCVVDKARDECVKAGLGTLFNLRLNFFGNYSIVVQGCLARIDMILKLLNTCFKDEEKDGPAIDKDLENKS